MNVTLPGIMAQAHAQPRRPLWPWSLVLGLQTHGTSSELILMPRAPAAAGGETESQNWRLSMQVRMRVRVHLHKNADTEREDGQWRWPARGEGP